MRVSCSAFAIMAQGRPQALASQQVTPPPVIAKSNCEKIKAELDKAKGERDKAKEERDKAKEERDKFIKEKQINNNELTTKIEEYDKAIEERDIARIAQHKASEDYIEKQQKIDELSNKALNLIKGMI